MKAINVDKINGNELYTNEATTTATQWIGKSVVLYDSQGNKTSKQLNLGQKLYSYQGRNGLLKKVTDTMEALIFIG